MSQLLELPEPLFAALQTAAAADGTDPVGWVAARLAERGVSPPVGPAPRTMGDLFAGRLGRISSGGKERLSEEGGEKFADHLEAQRRAGHL